MKALWFQDHLEVRDIPAPKRLKGDVLIRVTRAGICNTDLEITRGYVPGFRGVPGHEFIGIIEEADDTSLIGKRATAEINCSCGACDFCQSGLGRHCPHRTVIGIVNRQGAFAEYIAVPVSHVVLLPDSVPDTQAIFIEPLAAALEILSQVPIDPVSRVLLLGDGKLAQLIARVLCSTGCSPTVVGKHAGKLDLLRGLPLTPVLLSDFAVSPHDVVIEATGNSTALELGLACTRPRGTLVLKSTYAAPFSFNPSSIVVNEITLVGSRCGLFTNALEFLATNRPQLESLITASYPLHRGPQAFQRSSDSQVMKVILEMNENPQ